MTPSNVRQLPPSIALRRSDEKLIEHPDRAVIAKLLKKLQDQSPDVEGAIDGLARMLRLESREQVFVAAAAADSLSEAALDRLIVVCGQGKQGPLFAQAPDGKPPAGVPFSCTNACSH